MKISFEKGHKGKKDRIITITTIENEWFSIYKLCVLLNQLSINEQGIRKDNDYTHNYYEPAIKECLEISERGIDWAEEKNLELVKKWCLDNHLKYERIEPELQKIIQTKLKGFENATNQMG